MIQNFYGFRKYYLKNRKKCEKLGKVLWNKNVLVKEITIK